MNNRTFRTFEQFEEAWRQEPVPSPESTPIHANRQQTEAGNALLRWFRPLTVGITLLCVGVVLIIGPHAYAVFTQFIIHDSEGKEVFKYTQTSQEQMDKDEQVKKVIAPYDSKMKEMERTLGPGEAVIFLITEAYKIDRYYYPIQARTDFKDLEQLKSRTSTKFNAPAALPDAYRFSEGTIWYSTVSVTKERLDQWYEEAVNLSVPYLVKPIQLTNQAQSISLTYVAGSSPYSPSIHMYITESTGYTSTSSLNEQETEIVDLGGVQAIYEQQIPAITFVIQQEGTPIQYTISGDKQDILLIAEELAKGEA